MANPPPPYDNITGISRAVMKDNAQETLAGYDGSARPGELVVDQTTSTVYVGNALGELTAVATPGGATTWALLGDKVGAAGPTIIALGQNAGLDGQAAAAVALGEAAGQGGQGAAAISIGLNSGGNTLQGAGAVAIGSGAAYDSQGVNAVAVGAFTATTSQGARSVAIGLSSGQTTQGTDAVAMGQYAGNEIQGVSAVAIGNSAGYTSQGNRAVAIGSRAGETSQGVAGVALGEFAGQLSQGVLSVAIGYLAGSNTQSFSAVAIGAEAGETAQGSGAIAIGDRAGRTSQASNSIIINATGANLDQTTANTFTVAPMRNDVANVGEVMFYNTTSKEITYGNTISVAGNVSAARLQADGNLELRSNVAGTAKIWTFDTLGDLNLPVGGNISGSGYVTAQRIITDPVPLANLTAVAGGRAFASDANLAATGNFGAQISGGAGNTVPIWSDGTNWYIG